MADLAVIQNRHPEWNIISVVDAPGGGVWALGKDGGVFALDQAGNASPTTPFFGAYTTLPPAQRAGYRTFTAIQRNQQGGYTLVSNLPGQVYDFADPTYAPPPGAPGTTGVTAPAPAGAPAPSATDRATVDAFLASVGLSGLADRAFSRYQELGATPNSLPVIMLELRGTPEYQARFPGMAHVRDLAARGEGTDWTEAEYLQYEDRAMETASRYNLPKGYLTRSVVGDLINNDWSIDELTDTIEFAAQAAVNTPPEVVGELNRLYGLDASDLTVYYLDPGKGVSLLEEQTRLRAAGIGAASTRVGFGELSRPEAERLGQLGMTGVTAATALAGAARLQPLTNELIGETEDLGRSDLLASVEGNVPAEERLQRRRASRVAAFSGGGGVAGFGAKGSSGLGSADQ